ncbi:MAG: transketolase family protein [Clostridia bacterium]|nr:transketolase family protein [Clostridia bacterium]
MKACRKAFTETLLEIAKTDKKIWALATDSRGSVTLTDFAKELPGQFVECGIAEQDAVGIAAGLTLEGKTAFVCGPASFYATRSAEQVKVDVAYSHRDVKVIGVSGGVSYGALGGTHHAVQDIAFMRAVPNLQVFIPADAAQASAMTKALAYSGEPAYVRMGRGDVEDVYTGECPFEIGKANVLKNGTKAAIIACGEMVYPSLKAAEILAGEGVDVSVIDMHTIKPLDEAAIIEAAKTGLIVTVEEHSVKGGLGGAVAEVVCEKCPVKMRILGLPDETLYSGTNKEVFEHYGLTAAGIAGSVREALK